MTTHGILGPEPLTIEEQIRELLDSYAEARILIRKTMTTGPAAEGDGNYRLAGAVVHLTRSYAVEIMNMLAMDLAEDAEQQQMYSHWRT